jgi:hypothetical protein
LTERRQTEPSTHEPTTEKDAGREEADAGVQSPEAILETLSYEASDAALFPGSLREEYFFAYDLLLDPALISRHTKGLQVAKIVYVPNHRLVWPYFYPPMASALPSLERTNREGDTVWGILYDARKKNFGTLEQHLKVPNRYHRLAVNTIDRGGRRFPAFTYVLTPRDLVPGKPSTAYRDRLLAAAEARGLPEEWLASLRGEEVSG